MTIQKTAFEVQSALRTAHGIHIKRSHVHEVLAALFGHASYAAMSSQCVVAQFLGQTSLRPLDIIGAAHRAQALGYAPPGPPVIATVGAEALNTHRLCAMKLDKGRHESPGGGSPSPHSCPTTGGPSEPARARRERSTRRY